MRDNAQRTAREKRGGKTGQHFCRDRATGHGIETGSQAGARSRSGGEDGSAGRGRERPWVARQANQTAADGVLAKLLFPASVCRCLSGTRIRGPANHPGASGSARHSKSVRAHRPAGRPQVDAGRPNWVQRASWAHRKSVRRIGRHCINGRQPSGCSPEAGRASFHDQRGARSIYVPPRIRRLASARLRGWPRNAGTEYKQLTAAPALIPAAAPGRPHGAGSAARHIFATLRT